jgi:hypothetical protein
MRIELDHRSISTSSMRPGSVLTRVTPSAIARHAVGVDLAESRDPVGGGPVGRREECRANPAGDLDVFGERWGGEDQDVVAALHVALIERATGVFARHDQVVAAGLDRVGRVVDVAGLGVCASGRVPVQ